MSRWIEADATRDLLIRSISLTNGIDTALREAPSIDLVRCAECRHCLTDIVVQRREDGYERAINLCRCPRHREEWSVDKDWFCADAERREIE